MNTKQETAAEVLADVRNSADMHERNGSVPFPAELRSIADRLERALSAQGEAVATVHTCNKSPTGIAVTWAAGDTVLPAGTKLYTHPAPARVTEEAMRVLAKLSGAAGLMLSEIDTCGHEVDPAYRANLHEAWEESRAALTAALEADRHD